MAVLFWRATCFPSLFSFSVRASGGGGGGMRATFQTRAVARREQAKRRDK